MNQDEKDLVPLTTCGTNEEAAVIKSVLESEGIYALVQGEGLRGSLGNIYGSFVEIRVLVPSGELNRARELITRNAEEMQKAAEEEALASGAPSEELAPLPEGVPVAGEDHSAKRRKLAWTLIAVFWIIPLALVFLSSKSCGR